MGNAFDKKLSKGVKASPRQHWQLNPLTCAFALDKAIEMERTALQFQRESNQWGEGWDINFLTCLSSPSTGRLSTDQEIHIQGAEGNAHQKEELHEADLAPSMHDIPGLGDCTSLY